MRSIPPVKVLPPFVLPLFVLPLFVLAPTSHALEANDIVGTWKGQLVEEFAMTSEIYFNPNGTLENRTEGTALVFTMRGTAKGQWRIQGNDIWGRNTSGWTSINGAPAEPLEPDTGFTPAQAVIVAGNPRILRFTDCEEEDPEDCTIQEFRFVSSGRQFTIPEVAPGTAIRRTVGKAELHRNVGGFYTFRFSREGRVYDLKGRSNPAGVR